MRLHRALAWSRLLAVVAILAGPSIGSAAADPYSVLYAFKGRGTDGRNPTSGLATDVNGRLYGTTVNGGTDNDCGIVFRLTKPASTGNPWTYEILRHIGLMPGQCHPSGTPLVKNGFVYATNLGTGNRSQHFGSVFRTQISGGSYFVLHEFDKQKGWEPKGLAVGADGAFYGTTRIGGPDECKPDVSRGGVLYRTTEDKSFRVLHNFGNATGENPTELVVGPDGALYGGTRARCGPDRGYGGVIFRQPLEGGFSIIYRFDTYVDTGLTFAPDGTLYGVVGQTAFSLMAGAAGQPWTYRKLHDFTRTDGLYESGSLALDSAGNLYGTLQLNTKVGGGVIFRLSPPSAGGEWAYTVLHRFEAAGPGGSYPQGSLLLKDGVLYGTAEIGGNKTKRYTRGAGVVFSYTLP